MFDKIRERLKQREAERQNAIEFMERTPEFVAALKKRGYGSAAIIMLLLTVLLPILIKMIQEWLKKGEISEASFRKLMEAVRREAE